MIKQPLNNMKAEDILKKVQRMYRNKKLILSESKENIMIDTSFSYECSGEIYSDDTYTKHVKRHDHFCSVEFARRLFKKTVAKSV